MSASLRLRRWRLGLAAMLSVACGDGAEPSTTPEASSSPPPKLATPSDGGESSAAAWGGALVPIDAGLEAKLRAAELDRDVEAAAIDEALASADPNVRARGAWTLARIGGPVVAQRFVGMLGDGVPALPASGLAAIAALDPPAPVEGDLVAEAPWGELSERLWQHYAVAQDADRAVALLLAIARVGGAESQVRLGVDLVSLPAEDAERSARALDAMAILCRRGFGLDANAFASLAGALAASQPEVRRAAAQTLQRCAGPSAEQLAGEGRKAMAERLAGWVVADDEADAHAGWNALAAIGEVPKEIPASILGKDPPAWRTEVAAVRALAANADGRIELAARLAAVDPSTFEGPRWHALLEAVRGLRGSVDATPELAATVAPLRERVASAREGADARITKALTLVDCELAVLDAIVTRRLDGVTVCAAGVEGIGAAHGDVLAIEALTHVPASPTRADALVTRAGDARSTVAAAALGALAELDDPRVSATLRDALGADDVGRVSAAAGAIATRAVDRQRRDPEAVAPLVAALARLSNDAAVEARVAALDALGALARSSGEPQATDPEAAPTIPDEAPSATPWLHDSVLPLAGDPNAAIRAAARRALAHDAELRERFDAAVPARFPGGFSRKVHAAADAGGDVTALVLTTDAGTIEIAVADAPSPIARGSFATLAEQGYFEGLTFHRVVPDFVIQGGDPRGDGYGGPGYVIPCEWSNLRYERGTVGIALAGKDTGGSQLFVTHGRPVHLDARYTVLGHVRAGQDVVDAILPYDVIRSVKVERDGS